MEKVVGDIHLTQVLVYLDDIIVFGKMLEEHDKKLLCIGLPQGYRVKTGLG